MKCFLLLLIVTVTLSNISSAQRIELINSGELLKTGGMVHDSGQYKKALSIYNKISRSDTNYVRSLYERAMTCEADSQYKQAIKYCEEAIALHEQRDYLPDLYNIYGNTMHDIGQPEKALIIFDTGIARFPSYSLLYFNKGVVLLALKKYAEAETWFQKALMVNPYMYSAHYQLGLAALKQGKIIPAYLCFIGYLLTDPSGRYWSQSINYLSQISKGTDEILDYKNKRTINPDGNYQEVEDILLSKIALDNQYKPIIALDDQISRQIQALFEKLEYSSSNNDFYMQYYFAYYKKTFTDGKFELFINHLFSNTTVKIIQDYNKKNKKTLDVFVNEAGDYFNLLRATRELNYNKREAVNYRYYFENGKLVGKGVLLNGKTLTGHWEFYFPAGNIKSLGEYNPQGEREGDWLSYYTSGVLKAKELYRNGKLEGIADYYYENGNLSSHEPYVNNQLEGLATSWYYAGSIKLKGAYKLGKRDGEVREYYSNGNLQTVNNYVAGVLSGPATVYFKSGGIKKVQQYVDGKSEGDFKLYNEGGSLSLAGQNMKDKSYGEWKYYYDSGKLKETRNYVNDIEEGLHNEYFETGQLSGTYSLKKGKINGEVTSFFKDGKVLSKFIYDNGIVRSVKFFDQSGAQLSGSEMKNDLIDIVSYGTDGRKTARYGSDRKGDLTGPDTLYYPSGSINQIAQYTKGNLNGLLLTYYYNGQKKSEINYTDGKENGYFTKYYTNGKTEMEGWIVDDNEQGEWDEYDEKGRISSRTYYLNNDINGYKEEYFANGAKNIEQKYHNGWLEKMTQFDTTGKVLAVDSFPRATGKYVLYYPNMKVMEQGSYINGDFDGAYKTFFFDGSLATSFFYKKGLQNSTYLSFYYGGTKNTEGFYRMGNKTATWKNYDENGKLTMSTNYANDERNGQQVRFFPNGNKSQLSIYKDDELNGIYIRYDHDGALMYQINFEEGKAKTYSYTGKDGHLVPSISIPPTGSNLKAYFQNGKIAREFNYVNGIKNGKDIMYYPNGQVWFADSTAYAISDGLFKEYYPDGKLKSEYPYATDNVDGICREYNTNGTLKKEEHYDNGSYNGTVTYFDSAGKVDKTMYYRFGILTAVKNEK